MDQACVFCDLIRDDSANWVAVEEHALAFQPLPEDTIAPGITVVIPRVHSEGLWGPTPFELGAVMDLARRVAAAQRSGLGSTGTILMQGSGPDSGGTVPHFHVHVLPCWADDEAWFWPRDRSAHVVSGDPYESIRAHLGPPAASRSPQEVFDEQ